MAHEDRIEKGKIGENADRVEDDPDREPELLKARELIGTHEAREKENEEDSRESGSRGEIEDRIDRKERAEDEVHDEIVVLPELRRLPGKNESSGFDLDLAHEKCAENHEIDRLLDEIEEIVDPPESQEIEDEAAEEHRHRDGDFVLLIVGKKPCPRGHRRRQVTHLVTF